MNELDRDEAAAQPAPESDPRAADIAPATPAFPAVGFGRLVLWLLGTGVLYAAFVTWRFGPKAFDPSGKGVFTLSIWLYGSLLGWFAWALPRAGISLRRLLGPRPTLGNGVEAAFITVLHLQLSAMSFLAILVALSYAVPDVARRLISEPHGGGPLAENVPTVASFALLVLVGPFVEEVLFRGLMFHRLAARFPVGRAAVATSFVFAILHLNPIGIFALGLMLNIFYVRTRSLWACIVSHALNNLVPFLLLMAARGAPERSTPPNLDAFRSQAIPALVGFALVASVWFAYMRYRWPRGGTPTPWAANAETPASALPVA